jgi:hypothetical protein
MWQRIKPLFRTSFSLREMILATTAVAGLAAAFYTHRAFGPTAFVLSYDPRKALNPLVKREHPVELSYSSGGGTLTHGNASEAEYELVYAVTKPDGQTLLDALKADVRKAFDGAGCEITGRSEGELCFGFYYQKGATMGFMKAYALDLSDRVKIRYLAYEHR